MNYTMRNPLNIFTLAALLLTSPAALSAAGRTAARGFDVGRLVQRTLDVYRSLDLYPGS